MRVYGVLAACIALAACSGGRVSGEIGQACMAANRSAASPVLCGCIQGVANESLSGSDQRRAATFFAEPDLAQSTRQADGRASEAFWDRYTAFADRARGRCG